MMGRECAFCGSEFWDNDVHCYGCRLTLPTLSRLGHLEVNGYLLGQLTAETAKAALRKASASETDDEARRKAIRKALKPTFDTFRTEGGAHKPGCAFLRGREGCDCGASRIQVKP